MASSSPHQPPPYCGMLLCPPQPQAAAACTSTFCCTCGIPMPPNPANTCARCLSARVDVTEGAPRHLAVVYCPSCSSYLDPPRRWLRAAPESSELMLFLLCRVHRPLARLGVALYAAEFVFTDPHSKRLKIRLRLRREVLHGVTLEQAHVVEFTVHDRLCDSCVRARADPDQWSAVVQVRQRASHRRTLLHLEQRLVSLGGIAGSALRVDANAGGLDFFFASRSQAANLVDLISSLAPVRTGTSAKQLVSHDTKSNSYNYKHAFSVELCPVCRDDLVFLPREASRDLGSLGPLVLCVKVTDALALLDTSTLRVVHLGIKEYDRYKFEPVLTSRQLVEYVVLDVEADADAARANRYGYRMAYAQVARASDLGKKDTIFTVRTHLGHLLNPGDLALGYDLHGANANNHDVESYGQIHCLPDAVLVKKCYEKGSEDGSKRDRAEIDKIAMGIGGIDLNPSDEKELDFFFARDEKELDELLEDLTI